MSLSATEYLDCCVTKAGAHNRNPVIDNLKFYERRGRGSLG